MLPLLQNGICLIPSSFASFTERPAGLWHPQVILLLLGLLQISLPLVTFFITPSGLPCDVQNKV